MAVDREKVRELSQWIDDATCKAGVLAMVVADKLASGDIEGARAALPAYQEQSVIAEGLGDELARLSGWGYGHGDEGSPSRQNGIR